MQKLVIVQHTLAAATTNRQLQIKALKETTIFFMSFGTAETGDSDSYGYPVYVAVVDAAGELPRGVVLTGIASTWDNVVYDKKPFVLGPNERLEVKIYGVASVTFSYGMLLYDGFLVIEKDEDLA